MRLDLHPDVYRALHDAGIRAVGDKLVAFLAAMEPTVAVRYVGDPRVATLLMAAQGNVRAEPEGDGAEEEGGNWAMSRIANQYRIDTSIRERLAALGYEPNANICAFFNGFSSLEEAHAHIDTMRPRRRRIPDAARPLGRRSGGALSQVPR